MSNSGDVRSAISNWLQFAVLLVTIIVLAMHGEGRLSRIEQAQADAERSRAEMVSHLDRIESRLDGLHDER